MEKFIFVSGPPGSGKNTQAKFICEELGYTHFDSGDMVRRLINSGELDQGENLEKGLLMPIERVLFFAKEEVKKMLSNGVKGLVISGIPRSQEQAFGIGEERGIIDWLDEVFGKTELLFFHIEIPEEESIKRNLKRGEGRKDDNPESLKTRMREYQRETAPTFSDLKERGYKVVDIDGRPSREEVFAAIRKHLVL